ncbi:MAG: NAD(P)H-dependent oxidoreductase [Herminiimonas sp.]|nr:NAD(P)H-dependent oxidoreductase [Herminiimonas sp.]
MSAPLHILGISGSLRKNSYNSAALRAASELLPEGVTMEIFDLSSIPMYNDDVREQGYPAAVQTLREKIATADAVLIATPEYNYSVPGMLKNAIDWASRPPSQPFDGKPIGIIGASPGVLGTARAQYHLRQMFVFMNGMVLNRPEVMIGAANTKFDANGKLTDAVTRDFLQKFLVSLAAWSRRMKPS